VIKHLRGAEGFTRMPLDEPLAEAQIKLFADWIRGGATDDTPAEFKRTLTVDGPPSYERPVAVTALAYSPDGSLLAVSGYREVLLHRADGLGTRAGLPALAATMAGTQTPLHSL